MSDITLKDLLEAGSHFGHQSRRWNPKMNEYIYGEKDKVHIFDLAKTKSGLDAAVLFLKRIVAEGSEVLFVATKRQAAEFVKNEAIRNGMPYVTQRWMGGMLTNFSQLTKSVNKLKDLKEKKQAGELKRYTKKEQLLFDRDIAKLEKFLGGVSNMSRLPAAMFVVDTHKEDVAVREAVRVGIPVVGIVDTNGDPSLVEYVIPANDDAVNSIELIVKHVSDAMFAQGGKVDVKVEKVEAKKPAKVKKAKKDES